MPVGGEGKAVLKAGEVSGVGWERDALSCDSSPEPSVAVPRVMQRTVWVLTTGPAGGACGASGRFSSLGTE